MDSISLKKIKKLLQSNEFESVIKLYAEVIDKWSEQNCIGSNEFETLKLLFTREGKKEGLREFFKILEEGE